MTIWILVVVLLASLAALGYRQGAIRVACSFVGILVATLLALPLSPLIKPVVKILGAKSLLLSWLLPPLVVFILINILFKVAAQPAHRKVDMFYKYKAGDLRQALFERLNARLGLCLGLLNGTLYLILISFVIYMFGYWTVPLGSSDDEKWTVRLFNRVALDLQSTGFTRVAKAVDPLPAAYYDAADLAGLIYHNPLVEGRLARYPSFLALGARPEFEQLGKDPSYTELRVGRKPIRELIGHPQIDAIIKNEDLLKHIWGIVLPDMADLTAYLTNGVSAKYDPEKILGCWSLDFNSTFAQFRKANSKLSALQLREMRKLLSGLFLNTSMVVGTDGYVVLKSLPHLKLPKPGEAFQAPETRNLTGKWKGGGGSYELSFEEGGRLNLQAEVDSTRMTLKGESLEMVFERDL